MPPTELHPRTIRNAAFAIVSLVALMQLAHPAHAVDLSPFNAGQDNRMGLTFSPDGRTAFWVEYNGAWGSGDRGQRLIYVAHRDGGRWTAPRPAPFSANHSDSDPFVSPDGQWLYFVSDRPVDGSMEKSDADVWRYRLFGDDQPQHLSVNSPAEEYSPVAVSSGALYFASAREGGVGRGDIYRAASSENDAGFGPAELLGSAINSPTGEWNLWVSADEQDLIFEASSRPSNVSIPGDLYYSWRTPSGWTAAVPIASLNSKNSDLMPRLYPDGATLHYTSAPIGGHARIVTANWARVRRQLRSDYAPLLLVANRSSHDVAFVDLARGEVVARVPTGKGPHLLSNVSRGLIVATGYGDFPQPHAEPVSRRPPFVQSLNARLTVIDVDKRTAVLERKINGCAKPHASWIVASLVYVTCEDERQVLALELGTGDIVRRFDTRQDGSHVLQFEEQSQTLAVANTGSGSLTLINVADGETRIVDLPAGSEGLFVNGRRFWVGNARDGSVSVVDPRSASVAAQMNDVCGFPIALSAVRRNEVWVACFGSGELVKIDSESYSVVRRIRLGDQPLHFVLHPARALAYVSYPRQNAIGEIDLVLGREVRRIEVGGEPDGMRWGR